MTQIQGMNILNESLYNIGIQYQEAIEQGYTVDEETGEVTFNAAGLDELEKAINVKADYVACYIKNEEAMVNALDDEIKALQERKKLHMNKVSSMKNYLARCLEMNDIAKLETARNKISFRKSNSLSIFDEQLVPSKYKKQLIEEKIDKMAIKDALKKGEIVDGCYIVETRNIQIK